MFYIYNADVYCEACGEAIKADLDSKGLRPDHSDDESTYDSGDYPKGPYPYEEADHPEHCGSGDDCLEPLIIDGEKYGKFFGNPLTDEGLKRLLRMARANEDHASELIDLWGETYGDDWLDGRSLRDHLS